MKSSWINIDKLGTKGVEPDLMPAHRDPHSLDEGENVRSLGPNLANAGGYRLVANGTIPDEVIPSNCACPDEFYDTLSADGELFIDRSWRWDYLAPHLSVSVVSVGLNAQEYDQVYHYATGECVARRQGGVFLEVLNTASSRRVRLTERDINGGLVGTYLDYDASTEFGDGNVHYVVIEEYRDEPSGAFGIYLDGTQLFRGAVDYPVPGDWVRYARSNSPAGLLIPVAFWTYTQQLLDCLNSGNYNGFGGCIRIVQHSALQFDQALSDVDIDLYNNRRVAAPVATAQKRRSAYLVHPVLSGKIYFECMIGIYNHPIACYGDNSSGMGGVARGTQLGTSYPGQVANSWGLMGNTLYINGGIAAVGLNTRQHSFACIDLDTGDIWVGNWNPFIPGKEWAGSADPYAGDPALYNLGPSYDHVICVSALTEDNAFKILSGPDSCRFAPPDGFGYVETT